MIWFCTIKYCTVEASTRSHERRAKRRGGYIKRARPAVGRVFRSMSDAIVEFGVCPLALEIMVEPVTIGCGHNFERSQLDEWMKQKTRTLRGRQASKGIHECPTCRKPFHEMPAVNVELKQIIERFILPAAASAASAVVSTPAEAPPPTPEHPAKRPRNKKPAQASSSSQASGSSSGTEQLMAPPPDLLRLISDLMNHMQAGDVDPSTVDVLIGQTMSALEEFQPPLTPYQRSNLNAQANSGHTALYKATNLACKYGAKQSRFLMIVKRLIELGADLDLRSKKNNYTALGCAIWWGNEDVAKMLIMAGAQRQFGRLGQQNSQLSKSGDMDYLTLARHGLLKKFALAKAMEKWTSA